MLRAEKLTAPDPRQGWHDWLLCCGYLGVFLALDWVSYIRPLQGLNITPWNPQPALAIALLLWRPAWSWLVCLGLIAAELLVRGIPQNIFVVVSVALALTIIYQGAARALVQCMELSPMLARRRDLLWMIAVSLAAALVSAVAYVTLHAFASSWDLHAVGNAVIRYWIGDAVGLIVALPIVLTLVDAKRRSDARQTIRSRTWWLICASVAVLLGAVFWREDGAGVRFVYLLLLPVIWSAARFGLVGAVLASAVTQVGLIASLQSVPNPDLTVFETQALMAVLTLAALLLGVTVDERARVADELQRSLRLAAAGQMAAALAHELSQPLTALSNYAEACRLIVSGDGALAGARQAQLVDVTRRMADDAQRAGAVIKRLRDFFRQGTTRLQPTDMAKLVKDVTETQQRRAASVAVSLRIEDPGPLPLLLIDAIQMEVVLRNLLTNAIDAAAVQGSGGRVVIQLSNQAETVTVEVLDNGPGVEPERLEQLFEPGTSDKPGGMGVGLSICRAIVEAHGGRLWAEAGSSGRFGFSLPFEEADLDDGSRHAS